jgi:uncharacterized YccA/Bax inhibitor family protein
MSLRTSNPALTDGTFDANATTGENTMTLGGTAFKTLVLITIAMLCGAIAFKQFPAVPITGPINSVYDVPLPPGSLGWFIGSSIVAFIFALVTCFSPRTSWLTAPIYAALEGISLGIFSSAFEGAAPGVVSQALAATGGTLVALLVAYMAGIIKPSENLKLMIVAATGGIALMYLMTAILSLFGVRMPYIHESGMIGIGFSAVVVGVAAFNLVLDFDFIESGVERKAPAYYEWYGAFGLMVTLVWLYIEFLKLFFKLYNWFKSK